MGGRERRTEEDTCRERGRKGEGEAAREGGREGGRKDYVFVLFMPLWPYKIG